ncbi:MAG: DUF2961 domain-containing protein [Armatimonadetes bacterium]|nr:DUF2961 domain-containing protein [Armatimonadota bacterium]
MGDQEFGQLRLYREWRDLPLLPRQVSVHQFSSHNRQGDNGDAGWHLYDDTRGDGVVFDACGPGCVKSIWMTSLEPSQVLMFYLDGEAEPSVRLPAIDFFKGEHPLFPAPLNSYRLLGHWGDNPYAGNSFVPIPFERSLKIAMEGGVSFYHILYERYPYGTPIHSFTGREDRSFLLGAFAGETGAGEGEVYEASADHLMPGERLDLPEMAGAGAVTRIVLEGDGSEDFFRQAEIEMRWDDAPVPDVLAPVGMLFGAASRAEKVESLPVRVERREDGSARLECRFPMPFWRKARVSLVNRISPSHPTGPVRLEARVGPNDFREHEAGYFHALYREGRTEMGRDWLLMEGRGTGWFLGAVQSMWGGHYCEGDEHFTLDGASMPQINGTGSEDYYLGCFWPNRHFCLPFAGCVGDAMADGGGYMDGAYHMPSSYYRFHLESPIPFYRSLDARIQHGGRSDILSRYRSLAFCYLRKQPVLHRTDFLDVGSPASEKAHHYAASGSQVSLLTACYEGQETETAITDCGRTHASGEISFRAAIRPHNDGVRLIRRLDQGGPRQAADIYVDGAYAGTWLHADTNPYLRWFDSEFDLHPDFTRGKESLNIRLAVLNEPGYGAFSDFSYEVSVFESRSGSD